VILHLSLFQDVMPNCTIEEALYKHFFPGLAGKVDISEIPQELFALPVKVAGMAIPNPITSAERPAAVRDEPLITPVPKQHQT
jgi:hypothetical protein